MTGSTTTTTNCRRSNLVSLFLEETGTAAGFSVGERASVCLCVYEGDGLTPKMPSCSPDCCLLRAVEVRLLSFCGFFI